jgi:ATP sulfurylase
VIDEAPPDLIASSMFYLPQKGSYVMTTSSENRELTAAILASALIRSVPSGGLPIPEAVRTYHEVLDALNAEHDRRQQAQHVPGFNRQL